MKAVRNFDESILLSAYQSVLANSFRMVGDGSESRKQSNKKPFARISKPNRSRRKAEQVDSSLRINAAERELRGNDLL